MKNNNNYDSSILGLSSDISRTTLENGLTVLLKEIYPSSVAMLSVWVKTGSIYETEGKRGISHYVEHMLFKSTSNRKVGQIAKEVHNLGGYINGFTDHDCTCYWIVVPSKYIDTALEIQADALLNSLFEEAEINKERDVIIEELKMYEDKPACFCEEKLMNIAFTKNPLKHSIIGYEKDLNDTNRKDLLNYYNTYYVPNNMSIIITGGISTDKMQKKIKNLFSRLPYKQLNIPKPIKEPEQKESRFLHITGDIRNARLSMGFHIPGLFSPEIYAIDLLSTILGFGISSRLYQKLREKKGIVSNISTSIMKKSNPGLFFIDSVFEAKNFDEVKTSIFKEIDLLKGAKINKDELDKGKSLVESMHIFSQETVEGQGRTLGTAEIQGDYRLSSSYIKNLFMVKEEEIQKAAQKYLTEQNCSIVFYEPAIKK